jgi:hypothetical protein
VCAKEAKEQNVWATGGVKIMAIPYKENKALCSPTGALEKKRKDTC